MESLSQRDVAGPGLVRTSDGVWVRPVGPGRLERRYQRRVRELETQKRDESDRVRGLAAQLETLGVAFDLSQRVERSCQRRLDRLEDRLDERERELTEAHRAHKRLALGLGALQRENEWLRQRAELAAAQPARLAPRPAWWRRWIGARREGAV